MSFDLFFVGLKLSVCSIGTNNFIVFVGGNSWHMIMCFNYGIKKTHLDPSKEVPN